MTEQPLITLTTDFGTRDGYVGAVKGAILSICPSARLIDVAHDVPPQDLTGAAWTLRRALPFYPPGTIHVVVVDPGVGTARRAVAIKVAGMTLIGPDNGLFSLALDDLGRDGLRCREITNPAVRRDDPATTFDGRDVFGPAGAWLARGFPFEELGPEVTDLKEHPTPRPVREGASLRGEVVAVDHFGNMVTNITRAELAGATRLTLRLQDGDAEVNGLYTNYEDAPARTPVLLIGSSGYLEIAVGNGSASRLLGLGRATTFTLEILA